MPGGSQIKPLLLIHFLADIVTSLPSAVARAATAHRARTTSGHPAARLAGLRVGVVQLSAGGIDQDRLTRRCRAPAGPVCAQVGGLPRGPGEPTQHHYFSMARRRSSGCLE